MECYQKPMVVNGDSSMWIMPLAVLGGAKFAAGLAKGKTEIDSSHTFALTARKNFSLT